MINSNAVKKSSGKGASNRAFTIFSFEYFINLILLSTQYDVVLGF
jgi:hypothetical protein